MVLTMGGTSSLDTHPEYAGRVAELDLYQLPDVDLSLVRGLLVGPQVDQIYLRRQQSLLDAFIAGGGRLVVCGQVVVPFAVGLTRFVPLSYRGVGDLTVYRLAEHPVWQGVDPDDLTFRRGVAGFYGRGHHPGPPADAMVVHGLGPDALPLDVVYPHGAGQVLLHGGNALWGYAEDDTTAARMTPQLLNWIDPEPQSPSDTGAGR
jgi:hypothetical protein